MPGKQEYDQMQIHEKKCPISSVLGALEIKVTLRFYFTLVRMAIIRTTNAAENDEGD